MKRKEVENKEDKEERSRGEEEEKEEKVKKNLTICLQQAKIQKHPGGH